MRPQGAAVLVCTWWAARLGLVLLALFQDLLYARSAPLPAGNADSLSPVIGILTQDWDVNHTYMAASYAKFVEMGGGQAVAIHHEAPLSQIRQLHRSLNGVLLPGGNAGPKYSDALSLLVNLTLEAARGPPADRVPLMAICLGFEMLVQDVAQNKSVRTAPWDSLKLPLPLTVRNTSRMFRGIPADLREQIANMNVTMHNHGAGASPEVFFSNARLHAAFDVTSVATDRAGRAFANVIEGKNDLPIFATIWHPEMVPFEHELPMIPHSKPAVRISQWVSDFFIQQCRDSNSRGFPTADALARALITGDAGRLTDCRGDGSQISECYYWERQDLLHRHAVVVNATTPSIALEM
jgi:gamma-glutamyl hydrolase